MNGAALKIEGCTHAYQAGEPVLREIDLEVADGEFVTLLGPSGCGKSTLLRSIAGFLVPDSGRILLDGQDVTRTPPHKRDVNMVFQRPTLFPHLDVFENVSFGLSVDGVNKGDIGPRVAEALALVRLEGFERRRSSELSGGQMQRVALARALIKQPKVLLLDEPLSALDAKVRASLRDEIRRIQTEVGITTLFVTHDQEEALGISDRIGVMSNGRLEQLAPPLEVYRHPASAFVARFVGTMNEFPATVRGDGAVEIAGHPVVTSAAATAQRAAGANLRMLVRPEDLVVSSNGSGLPGSVTSFTFQGASTTIGVRLDRLDLLVSASMPSATAPVVSIGDRVSVGVDATRAVAEPA